MLLAELYWSSYTAVIALVRVAIWTSFLQHEDYSADTVKPVKFLTEVQHGRFLFLQTALGCRVQIQIIKIKH